MPCLHFTNITRIYIMKLQKNYAETRQYNEQSFKLQLNARLSDHANASLSLNRLQFQSYY